MTDEADWGAALWRFGLATYARPGVADACLLLQDRAGADVNVLLALLWLGAEHGRAVGETALDRVLAAVGPWQTQIVAKLRDARRALKSGGGLGVAGTVPLYTRLKDIELATEKLEQRALATILREFADPPGAVPRRAAQESINRYRLRLSTAAGAEVEAAFACLLAASPQQGLE